MLLANYLNEHLSRTTRSRHDIAASVAVSVDQLEMMATGHIKVPVNRAVALAVALDVPASELLEVLLRDYSPGTWDAVCDAFDLVPKPKG